MAGRKRREDGTRSLSGDRKCSLVGRTSIGVKNSRGSLCQSVRRTVWMGVRDDSESSLIRRRNHARAGCEHSHRQGCKETNPDAYCDVHFVTNVANSQEWEFALEGPAGPQVRRRPVRAARRCMIEDAGSWNDCKGNAAARQPAQCAAVWPLIAAHRKPLVPTNLIISIGVVRMICYNREVDFS